MRMRKLLVFGAASLLGVIAAGALAAEAHSFPESERPSAGELLNGPPPQVIINYDAPIERLFAKLEVLGADGKNEAAGSPEVGSDGLTLSVKLSALKPGDYTVKWSVVCIDSHRTQGSYIFTVTGAGQ